MTMQGTVSGAGLREFATRQEAALNLAQRIKQALLSELEQNDRATLVLSGGRFASRMFPEFFRPSVCPAPN